MAEDNKLDNQIIENQEVEVLDKSKQDDLENTYQIMSPFRLILRRFFRSKLSIIGLIMIVFLFAFSFLGPVIYPKWGEVEDDRTLTETYNYNNNFDITDEFGNPIEVTELVITSEDINKYDYPSKNHLLGTDDQGRDVFVRLMYGGRISLTIGFIVVILETVLGVIIGGISGYFGGWVDNVIMRIVDIFNCIPTLPILLIASYVIDTWGLEPDQRIYVLMVIITIFSWSGVARLVRGQILSLREQEYMIAAEVMGLSSARKSLNI